MPDRPSPPRGHGLRRLLQRLVVPRPRSGETEVDPGPAAVADGEHAVAVTEAWIADAAVLSPGARQRAAGRAFLHEAEHEGTNLLGRPLTAVPAASPRGALAAAMGLAEAGRRATVFFTGEDLAASGDLLARAVERRLPLVIHLFTGTSDAQAHQAVEAGAGVLVAGTVQEAVDLTLVARRVAEEGLRPMVVVQDGSQDGGTAASLQDVHLTTPETVKRFLGDPTDTVHSATPAQEVVFGRHRPRLFAAHDMEHPRLAGATQEPAVATRAMAARDLYLDAGFSGLVDKAFSRLTALTGRTLTALTTPEARKKPGRVLVALGSVRETAEAAAEALGKRGLGQEGLGKEGLGRGGKAAVVGIRALAPFPAKELREALEGVGEVVVLERSLPAPGAPGGALFRAVSEAISGAASSVRVVSMLYGLGGGHPTGRDLVAALREPLPEAPGDRSAPLWLGLDPAPDLAAEPKRQAVRDALRREHPEVARRGLVGREPAPDLRPSGAVTVAVPSPPAPLPAHPPAPPGEGSRAEMEPPRTQNSPLSTQPPLLEEMAAVLHRAVGGHVRGWVREVGGESRLIWSPEPLREPGADAPVDVRLHSAGEIWVKGSDERNGKIFDVPGTSETSGELLRERQLGALFGVLERTGKLTGVHRKLLDARKTLLKEESEGGEAGGAAVSARLEAFTAGLDGVAERSGGGDERDVRDDGASLSRPVLPLDVGNGDAPFDQLPRFWDQVGSLARRGEGDRLLPDPALGLGTLPAGSALFRSFAGSSRDRLPVFDPAPCTGCGACWSSCPHGALEPAVVGVDGLIDTGMSRASAAGHAVDVLRGIRSRWVTTLGKELAGTDGGPAGPLLERSFEAAIAKMPLSEDRRAALGEAFKAVRGELEALPVARTEPFPDRALTVAVDPDACRACGLCIAVCEPAALTVHPDGEGWAEEARQRLAQTAALPAPTAETVEVARSHPEVGPLAGAMLDRTARRVMGGGEGAEPGSGAALAVRRALAVAAWHLAPRRQARLERLDELRQRLAAAVHDELAGALPERDLDALARGLEKLARPEADLGEITERVETAFDSERVDVVRLRRLVQVAREVADLERRVRAGAPFGLVLGPGAETLAGYPWNPFTVPVTVDPTGETAEVARGLAAGRLQEVLDEALVVRRAERELDRPQEAARGEALQLRLSDLTEDERRDCPPVWVVADEAEVTARGLAGLVDLLDSGLPVAFLSLSRDARRMSDERSILSRLHPTAARTSLSAPDHFEAAVAAAVDANGPALVRIHAPSPSAGFFAPEDLLARAAKVVESGDFVLYPSRLEARSTEDEVSDSGAMESEGQKQVVVQQQQMESLQADYETRLARARAEIERELRLETARRVRARLLEAALRGGSSEEPTPGPGRDPSSDSVSRGEAS